MVDTSAEDTTLLVVNLRDTMAAAGRTFATWKERKKELEYNVMKVAKILPEDFGWQGKGFWLRTSKIWSKPQIMLIKPFLNLID